MFVSFSLHAIFFGLIWTALVVFAITSVSKRSTSVRARITAVALGAPLVLFFSLPLLAYLIAAALRSAAAR